MHQLRSILAVAVLATASVSGTVLAANDAEICKQSNPFRNPQKTFGACDRAIAATITNDGQKAVSLAQRGEAFYWSSQFYEALSDFDAALSIDPELNETRIQRGWAKMRVGNLQGARADFTDALERNPRSGRAVFALAFMEPNPEVKRKGYEQAIEFSPNYYLAYGGLIGLDRQRPETRGNALERLDQLLKQGESKLNTAQFYGSGSTYPTKDYYNLVLYDRGDILYDLGLYDQSVTDFRKLQKLTPLEPAPYMREAEALLRLNDYKAAARVSETAYNLCMERSYFDMCGKAIASMMQANLHLGKFDLVIKYQGEVENSRHENVVRAVMSITLAQAYKSLGKTDEAWAAFVRTSEIEPGILWMISDPMRRLGYYEDNWQGNADDRFWNGLEACLLDEMCKVNV